MLAIGQNKSIDNSVSEIEFDYSGAFELIAIGHTTTRLLQKKVNLAELVRQNIHQVELCVKQTGFLRVLAEKNLFAEVNISELTQPYLIIGRLYQYQGGWRFRALNEGFQTLAKMQKYFNLSDTLFSSNIQFSDVIQQAQNTVQNVVSQTRTTLQESGIEQAVQSGVSQAVTTAKKLTSELQQTFISVMGNSDEIARQQRENETFKPMNMLKMQSVQFPAEISHLHLGLGWKSKSGTGLLKGILGGNRSVNVDLDLSAQILNGNGEVIDTVYFDKIRSDNHAITHYGDASQGGNGLQDDEIISVALNKLPLGTKFIAITATSQKGHQFNGIENGYFRVVNQEGMIPLLQINLDPNEPKIGAILGIFVQNAQTLWEFVAVSDYFLAKNINELSPNILHWAKLIGQARGIVPTHSVLLLNN